jgi:hypothetical protein
MSIRKGFKFAAIVVGAGFLLAQTIRIEKTNPPVRSDLTADPSAKSLFRRACYDCHSNETVWPWYSNVAPFSWLIGSDVKEGREHLNFSEWDAYPGERQHKNLMKIVGEMEEGAMPPWYYSMMHSDSRLTEAEKNIIKSWTEMARNAGSSKP